MGCDIHLYFEQKKDGKWRRIEIDKLLVPDNRNYQLFGFLAGVRDYIITPQFAERGIPEDTSMPCDFWIGDHSYTYAYLDEILQAPWEQYELQDCYFYIFCAHVIHRLTSFCGSLSIEEERNIRVIIGFDN